MLLSTNEFHGMRFKSVTISELSKSHDTDDNERHYVRGDGGFGSSGDGIDDDEMPHLVTNDE